MQAMVDVYCAQAVRRQCGPVAGQPVQQDVGITPAAVGDAQRDRRAGGRQRRANQVKTGVDAHPSL